MIITKFIQGLYSIYSKQIVKEGLAKLAVPRTTNEVELEWPFILCHNELISIGKGTIILANSRIQLYPEKADTPPYLSIGDNCMFGYRLCILVGGEISIGNNVLIASDVTITSENHGYNPEESIPYSKQKLVCKPISIGDNCWIGDKVTILPGVNIGEGCVIGAGSVVTKDIDRFSVAVGNPARVIKQYDFIKHEWVNK